MSGAVYSSLCPRTTHCPELPLAGYRPQTLAISSSKARYRRYSHFTVRNRRKNPAIRVCIALESWCALHCKVGFVCLISAYTPLAPPLRHPWLLCQAHNTPTLFQGELQENDEKTSKKEQKRQRNSRAGLDLLQQWRKSPLGAAPCAYVSSQNAHRSIREPSTAHPTAPDASSAQRIPNRRIVSYSSTHDTLAIGARAWCAEVQTRAKAPMKTRGFVKQEAG
eukprot:3941960-Rhodomonas_salina.3